MASIREIGNEICNQAIPGLLTVSDRIVLDLVCRLFFEQRSSQGDMPVGKVNALSNLFGCFGVTPADRLRLVAPEGKIDDAWASLD